MVVAMPLFLPHIGCRRSELLELSDPRNTPQRFDLWSSSCGCQFFRELIVGALIAGGGSGAVAASSHAGCERFRRTDPLLIGITRRALARKVGFPDTGGKIPEARWVRAMAFERAVNSEAFVSELLTRAVGLLGLARP